MIFFFFNSIPSDLFYLNIHIVIVKVIMITGCFAMYLITITCNHKNQRLQITFRLLRTCNQFHVITITDYNYNRSELPGLPKLVQHLADYDTRGSVWDRSGIRFDTKLKVYKAVVLPTLSYACETWTVYQRHAKRLNHFHTSCLRKLLKIKW